ncbi:hypothetical protein RJ55_00413 [Drechmeria coniospora]|nr:hypothetical protein RJ55_00413 [Drechmeria coniospora]
MPNTGKPSKDCHLCRKRRVKCDLGRPGCLRCIKYGVDCPGYRDQAELVFRNASAATVQKRKKRAEPHSASEPTSSACSLWDGDDGDEPAAASSTTASGVSTARSSLLVLPRVMSEHWTAHSVSILLNVYENLDFLSNTYRANPRDGPLVWAAHLFSRTYVTNIRYPTAVGRDSEEETRRELGVYLGRTLRSVAAAIGDEQGAFRDDVLATVWILANYELLVGSLGRMELTSSWHLHTRGLYSMLKARGSKPLLTTAGRVAFWPCYHMVQTQALVTNTECPPESAEWLGTIREALSAGEGFMLHISIFIVKCARVQSRIVQILCARDLAAAEDEYGALMAEMEGAERLLARSMAETTGYMDELDGFMRNFYFAAVVKGYYYVLLLVHFLAHHVAGSVTAAELKAKRAVCLSRTRMAAQEIIDSVPRMFGPTASGKGRGSRPDSPKVVFDALMMVWPLTACYVVPSTLPRQKADAEAALFFIGHEIGVRQALNRVPAVVPPTPAEAVAVTDAVGKLTVDDVW